MDRIRIFLSRCSALIGKRRLDNDLDDELRAHIEFAIEENISHGMTAKAARTAAIKEFGAMTQTKETYRMQRGLPLLEQLNRDLRFAFRQLSKSPGFTIVALLTLALGVGANTAVFSLINGLLLRPLPVPHAEQLTLLRAIEGVPDPSDYIFCTPFFRGLENRHEVFSDVFAYNGDTLQVKGPSGNENVPGMLVSGQFFQAMETAPLLGRYLTPLDDQPGGSPAGLAAVITEDFWNDRFNRAPDIVGRTLIIANTPFTIVGVMPKRFVGPDPTQRPEIYVPLSADPIVDAPRNHIDAGIYAWWIVVGARLKPGATMEQANAQLLTISDPILHEAGASNASFIAEKEKANFHFLAEPGSRGYAYARFLFRKPLVAMFALCGGILLLACLNLASLLMARGVARERELATRLAMGATRRRVIQQLLTESLVIAALGTALGLAAAPLVSHALTAMVDNSWSNVQLDASLDLPVFAFAALIGAVSTVLIGLVPALQATAGDLNAHIKDGNFAQQSKHKKLLPRMLMASEVALAMILVVGAGLLATSIGRLFKSGAGFDPRGLINVAFNMDKQQLEGDALTRLYQQLGEGLRHQPGVKSVSFEFIVPLSHRGWNGRYATPAGGMHLMLMNAVAPQYFSTMRIPLYLGREFNWNDTSASGLKIVLNQAAANEFFPGQNAIGQQISNPREKLSYQVVGVVGDVKYRDMEKPAPAAGYVPIQQQNETKASLTAVVRTDGPQGPLAATARTLAAQLAPTIPAPVVTSAEDVLNRSVSTERMMAILSMFFAACAMLVTGIGLYGTLAYATARRTSEIGIRIALGAQRASVVAMVFRENGFVALLGTSAGLVIAVLASRALANFLYETSPRDPWVLLSSVAALALIAGAASILPALRAARIDPMRALRNE